MSWKKMGFVLFMLILLSIFTVATADVSYGDNTVTVPVKVNLVGSCNIVNTPVLDFGDINSVDSKVYQKEITLNFTCSSGMNYQIDLGKGDYYDGSDRRMRHETSDKSFVHYTMGSACLNGQTTGSEQSCAIWGSISTISVPLNNNPVGKYNDNVVITVTAN